MNTPVWKSLHAIVKFPWGNKPGFNHEEVRVDSSTVLDDGGVLWEKYQRAPGVATWIWLGGEPAGRLHVQRVYKNVIRARVYEGDGVWSEVEGFPPQSVRFDGGDGWPKAQTDQALRDGTTNR